MAKEMRLIDANALKKRLDNLEASGGHKYYRKGMDDTLHFHMPNIIDEIPTVDAVPVVRCKDCKHRGTDYCIFHINGEPADEELLKKLDNDFCSYGERLEEA